MFTEGGGLAGGVLKGLFRAGEGAFGSGEGSVGRLVGGVEFLQLVIDFLLCLIVDFESLRDDGSLGGVIRVEVGLAKVKGPDLGGFVLAVGSEVGLDRVVVIDLVSDVGEAVGGVGGGEELVGVPDKVDVKGGDEKGPGVIAEELEEALVALYSGGIGWWWW